MGKCQIKLLFGVVVVISVVGCQANQRSDSGYSENLSQHSSKQLAHRHHNHHQHKLSSVSLGGRNSSRYTLIGSGNNYHQVTNGYHHQQAANVGHQLHGWYARTGPDPTQQNRRSSHPGHPRWKPTTASTTNSRTNQPGSTAGVRHVKRMLKHNNHHRNVTGKNVCTERRIVHVPIYRKTTVKHYIQPCLDQKLCTGIRANYEPTYHPVKREVYACCPGWETATTIADGCHNPICRSQCRNGGRCTAPDTCNCPAGFTGSQCEQDINECKIDKPCDQTCYNTEGSYYCTCRDGFILQPDRQSCKKIDITNDVATEAKDMESDVDYDSLDTRLTKLEKIIFDEDRRSLSETHELSQKVQYAMDAIASLRSQVSRLTQRLFPTVDHENRIN